MSKLFTATLLDGATGTQLMNMGMPAGVCPELWCIEHPTAVESIVHDYIVSGSKRVLTCTFGANRIKLTQFGAQDRCTQINIELAQCAKRAANGTIVGGNVGPTGKFLAPMGDLDFEQAIAIFREQCAALAKGNVDYIAIETMMDLQEARAALIGAKEACSLPVFVTMAFQNGYTLTGSDARTALIALQALGADAVGCNCGAGPNEMLPLIEQMAPYATVPLIAKPNAGLPALLDGQTVYSMSPDNFAHSAIKLAQAGASYLGGCCGTTPAHILALHRALHELTFFAPERDEIEMISSARKSIPFTQMKLLASISPTNNENVFTAMHNKDFEMIYDYAKTLGKVDAYCLCAVGDDLPEICLLELTTQAMTQCFPEPLCLRPSCAGALEPALRSYAGRAIVILDCCPTATVQNEVKLVAKKYGALVLG